MTETLLFPILAAIVFVLFAVPVAIREDSFRKNVWMLPALLSVTFLAFSLYAVMTEGLFGFWVEHTRNFWGNQIWFDLLLAIGIAWALIMPQSKSLGMHPLPWLVFVICTGSIGLLAMVSRMLYLKEKSKREAQRP